LSISVPARVIVVHKKRSFAVRTPQEVQASDDKHERDRKKRQDNVQQRAVLKPSSTTTIPDVFCGSAQSAISIWQCSMMYLPQGG